MTPNTKNVRKQMCNKESNRKVWILSRTKDPNNASFRYRKCVILPCATAGKVNRHSRT